MTELPEFEPYDGLSSDEVRVLQDLTKWSSARVAKCHTSLIGLIDKVRSRLEAYVDRVHPDTDWVPPAEWSMAYKVTVDGGAKLISEYYRREAKNPAMGLTDEQLELELQKAAVALLDTVPIEDVERVLRRRRYVEEHGDQRQPAGQRKQQNVGKLLREGR
jgi:hypothetical protein